MGFLILVLLYCCLGTNLLVENYNNSDTDSQKNTPYHDFSHIAEEVAQQGKQHADQEYQDYQSSLSGQNLPSWSRDDTSRVWPSSSPSSSLLGKDCASKGMKTCGSTGPNVCYDLNESCPTPSSPSSPSSSLLGKDCASKGMKTCGSTGPNVCYDLNEPCPASGSHSDVKTCSAHKSGTGSSSDKCPSVKPSDYDRRDSCDTGYVWNSTTKKCVKTQSTNSSSTNSQMSSPYSDGDFISRSQIPKGQEDKYILKSKIVPPVCPACPPVLACPSKAKCPPCPAPEPIQPCPPCARCPENPFTCKKVPDYSSPNVSSILPRPMLNDFSQF